MYSPSKDAASDLEDDDTDDTVLDTTLALFPTYRRRSDLFHVLRADHEDLLRYFRRMASADPTEYPARWFELAWPLMAHIQAEREIVYPEYLRCEATREDARVWLDEHADFEALTLEIDQLAPGDPSLLPRIRQLVRKLEEHVDSEESGVLPKLEASVSDDELDRVAGAFERRRRQIERELRTRRARARAGAGERRHTRATPTETHQTPVAPGLMAAESRSRRIRTIPPGREHLIGAPRAEMRAPEENRAPATPDYAPPRLADPQVRVQIPIKRSFLQARILVVDDDEADAAALASLLFEARYARVEITTDPSEVAELHRKNAYDLVLLALGMPGCAGFEVMEQLKQLDPDGHVPVVALASGATEQVRALRAGARDFVAKPFDAPEVLSRISTVLEARIPEVARRARYRHIERDLSVAAEIYRALLPSCLPATSGYEVSVVSRSNDDTSGDIYDVIARSNGDLVLLLADATGHGIGPALSATQLRSMVRIALRLGASLDGLVAEADRQLAVDLPPDRFVTAFVGELDPQTHTLAYHAPGQGPLLHWHAATGTAEWRNASAPPFGVALYTFQQPPPMILEEGDVIVLATDGLYERADEHGVLFGKDGAEAVMRRMADESATAIGDELRMCADQHAGGLPPEDDTTIVVLKRTIRSHDLGGAD